MIIMASSSSASLSSSYHESERHREQFENIYATNSSLRCKPLAELAPQQDSGLKDQTIMGVLTRCQHYKGTSKLTGGRASHDYSITFHIIDPSRSDPNMSIPVVWFFNGVKSDSQSGESSGICPVQRLLEASVGDIVVLTSTVLGSFSAYPQFTGSRGQLSILHNTHDYSTWTLLHRESSSTSELGGIRTAKDILHPQDWILNTIHEIKKDKYSIDQHVDTCKAMRALGLWSENWLRSTRFVPSEVTAGEEKILTSFEAICTKAMTHHINNDGASSSSSSGPPLVSPEITMTCVSLTCLILKKTHGTATEKAKFIAWDGTPIINATDNLPSTLRPIMSQADSIDYCGIIESAIATASQFSSRKLTVEQLTALRPQHHSSSALLGNPLIFSASEMQQNSYVDRLHEGQWVLIRNATFDSRTNTLSLKHDTAITPIPPVARDVIDIAERYIGAASCPPPRPTPTTRNIAQVPDKSSKANVDIVNLVGVSFMPPPAIVTSRGSVCSWYPTVDRFVRCDGDRLRFFFTIRLNDGYKLDVIFKDQDAEDFLGVSAAEYYQNSQIQSNLLKALTHLQNHASAYLIVTLKVYSGKPTNEKTTEIPPRVGIFKTKAPFSIR